MIHVSRGATRFAVLGMLVAAGLGITAIANQAVAAEAEQIAALNPHGVWPDVERIPLTKRLTTLKGKRVYLVQSWPRNSNLEGLLAQLKTRLEAKYPGVKVTIKDRNLRYSEDDPKLWEDMKANADTFVYAVAPSSSTTSYAFKWSAKLEKMGIPGSVLLFETLKSVGATTNEREGAPVRSTAVKFPVTDMTPAETTVALDHVIATLLQPVSKDEQKTGTITPTQPPRIAVTGTFDEVQKYFHEHGMADGLPFIPPTEARVAAMLKGTSHKPDEVVAKAMMPEGLRVTVEKVAINAVMAGCDPSYFPVVLATIEAWNKFNYNSIVRSTNSFGFMQIVNGPIRNELKMNSGVHLLGPGNHANTTIGRTLRLMVYNLGGGVPGTNLMAVIGSMATYPMLFAENEENSPWDPFSVSQGFKKGDNTLTLLSGGWGHAGNYGNVDIGLDAVAADMSEFESTSGSLVILSPPRAQLLKEKGMSKEAVAQYLWERTGKTLGELRKNQFFNERADTKGQPDSKFMPMQAPGSINVVVAGGDASAMMQVWQMYRPITVSIDHWK